jgi:hypothetical protein
MTLPKTSTQNVDASRDEIRKALIVAAGKGVSGGADRGRPLSNIILFDV